MNKYLIYKKSARERYNSFPMMFAFSGEQFQKGLERLGVTEDELVSIGCGGCIRKSDKDAYTEMNNSMDKELADLLRSDDEFVLDMFEYEFANHEYCITYDDMEVASACGIGLISIRSDERLLRLFLKARENYLKEEH